MNQQDPIAVGVARVRDLIGRNMRSLAEEQLEKLLSEHSGDDRVRRLQLDCLDEWHDLESARQLVDEMLAVSIDDPALLRRAYSVKVGAGQLEEAIGLVDRLRALEPGNPELLVNRVDVLERMKRLDEAEAGLDEAKAASGVKPLRIAQIAARVATARGRHEEAVSLLRDGLANEDLEHISDAQRPFVLEVHFVLAKVCDRLGDYDGAWAAATKAHELDGRVFRCDEAAQRLSDQRRVFSPATVAGLARADEVTTEPLIILGNPRSGTTLLDQILGMHPQVAAGGELMVGSMMQAAVSRVTDSFLPFPMNLVDLRSVDANTLGRMYESSAGSLRGDRRYLSNKALSMHTHLGMLTLCLPRLRVINLFRHPLDNIVSCYTTNLLASGHSYTNRIDWLAEIWAVRHEMQRYWPEVLEVPFLELHYEDLVGDQEHQTRRILDFLDVPFDDACLRFHESDRHATTLSQEQVKQKMYSTSKGRWRNYEKHLGPAIDRLGEFL